ncbi:MAG: cysteine desulfurase NifS [Armatimonadia bacterium]|nr:cysteine desulfurase NifS [Armatimonadia bacterium]
MKVYLDNNATTMVAPEVVEAMQPFFTELYGNPSSMHSFGGQVKPYVDRAREQVAELLGATTYEVIFTAGGSESNNMAIRGALEVVGADKRHIVTSRVEHPAVGGVFQHLGKMGYRMTELPVHPDGTLDMDAFGASLTPDTALVSIMWANNETGVVFPIEELAQRTKERGILLHVDAVQAVGKLPIDMEKTPVDMLSISGHKFHAPKGIGALYIRRGTRLAPLIIGGHQEWGKRAGTENVPGIVGLGAAAEQALEHLDELDEVEALRDRLEEGLLSRCADVRVNGKNRVKNTLNASFEYIEGESILLMMDDVGIAASSGSACASGSLEPSHVLRAMGVPFTAVHGSIRFSLSRYTTAEEIDYTLEQVPPIVERLRSISPFVQSSAS